MTAVTHSMPRMNALPSGYRLAAVARAVRAAIAAERSAEQEDSLPVPALATLRFVVAEYSHEMRTLGHYPESVLVAVKSAVRDVGTPIGLKPMVDALVTAAAQWCITAYFDAPSMETVVDEQDR